ncbi:MAG TPA: phosphoribosyltransferase family protein [Bacteriovoracaceae bacterium]|nr:phosphoribosyltransferase family protein [Bacteriovoracaceae bacterium]
MLFKNREYGGRKLGEFLLAKNFENPIIIGLPRGGVVTAAEVAKILNCPLQVVIVRKIGSPIDPEYGIGAMSEDEKCFFAPAAELFDTESEEVQSIVHTEREELKRRIKEYRGEELKIPPGRIIIIVDDGLATGVTASAAAKYLRKFKPQKLIFAAPVGPRTVHSYLKELCDEIILLETPPHFMGVGSWYDDFKQTTDAEVLDILKSNKSGDVPE